MPLKLKKSQTPSEPSSVKDELSGPWGRINPEPESVAVLRLCKKTSPSSEETHSYPYRALSCWHWRSGVAEEKLEIEAGSDLVTVKGCGLDRIVDALEKGSLEKLCEIQNESVASAESPIRVSNITIEKHHTQNG